MIDAFKPLIDSGLLNEETRAQIEEAWEAKVAIIREEVETEMRSEFATRFEHDKAKMVEALDRMVTESLTAEIEEISNEKARIAEDRVKTRTKLAETSAKFEKFLTHVLAKELNEFRNDRKVTQAALGKLESFVAEGLSRELNEFQEDKRDLVATKVKLVAEAKGQLSALKKDFITRSGKAISEAVDQTLRAEITQLKEDIAVAQQNNFGRRLFEAFASEFAATQLNENAEVRKLKTALVETQKTLEATNATALKAKALAESKDKQISAINEGIAREKTINELLKPLAKEKANLMESLLEGVTTAKLKATYDKYLPAVMNGGGKVALTESVTSEVTGNRTAKVQEVSYDVVDGNIVDMKRLAGLK